MSQSCSLSILEILSKEDPLLELTKWNDEIESNFSNTRNAQDTPDSIKIAAHQLHNALISFIVKEDPLQILDSFTEEIGILKSDWKEASLTATSNGDDDGLQSDKVANSLSLFIATHMDAINQSQSQLQCRDEDIDIRNVFICSHLIRSCKNLIRWNRVLYSQRKRTRNPTESLVIATERLCGVGTVALFLQILQIAMSKPSSSNEEMNHATDDLARQCTTILFHVTFGQAPEPCCQKALRAFASSLKGVEIIAKLLAKPNDDQSSYSVNVTLGLIKIVHNLVSSLPHMMGIFDAALEKYAEPVIAHGVQYDINLFTILVSTLAWALRSEPSLATSTDVLDRRSDLMIEIIHVLFALRSVGSKTVVERMELENNAMMTQLGIIIVDLLKLPNRNQRCYDCKLASLQLLMNAPKHYGQFLVVNHCICELLAILWLRVNTIVVELAGDVHSAQNAAQILPVLIVMNELVSSNEIIRGKVKDYIFPPSEEVVFLEKVESYKKDILETPEHGRGAKKNMQPLHAPSGTMRWNLIKLMTYTESNVKRCVSELLWSVCRSDPNEFILRCGFGNSVHMLSIKGMYKIPNK